MNWYRGRDVTAAEQLSQEQVFPAPIKTVEAGSPAERAGVRPGDLLLRVNGEVVTDVLAYRHHLSQGRATLEISRPVERPSVLSGVLGTAQDHHRLAYDPGAPTFTFGVEWEDPGLDFEEVLFDGIKKCANKCDFCYVHQMPRGFRKSLYIMDDDYRLSFLYGSFVTLTNLTEGDINRILDENLSPLYVSVHTANQDLRQDLMKWWKLKVKDPQAVQIRGMIERLESIDLYTQIVLVPGRNDREHLDDTVEYLSSRPNVISAAVVPIGLTGHRTNLPDVRTFSREEAQDTLKRLNVWRRQFLAERGTRFVFPSDELYLLAGEPLPAEEEYEGFPMLENGVGMIRDFLNEGLPDNLPAALPLPRKVILGTGLLFAESLNRAVEPLREIEGLDIEVRAVENKTFGRVTTVAGLLTGRCFRHAVKPGEADLLIVPPTTLRYGTELMLDDTSLSELRQEFRMDVRAGGSTLGELARVIFEGVQSSGHQWGMSAHAVKEGRGQA
ncbi:putative radical SAM enzyme, TIGR03279 family [Deinococcus hopiensis KR-140]|uniref:Putative radical SAM enzyme, TIGR03279 family n=1 Tax=Deinococcus hopiensis KR-140 TaxID=695939 RepID=A0A1W1V9C7_9DEIO|nr:putative radical SAM enzyme, TIGR03279 family [Deinococcus hopiensis KR-140]